MKNVNVHQILRVVEIQTFSDLLCKGCFVGSKFPSYIKLMLKNFPTPPAKLLDSKSH